MFVKVAECMSFAKAAKQLGVSTSMVTRGVAVLERHLGVQLVNRTTRNTALTPSGELYWKQSTELLHLLETMDECVTLTSSQPARVLRIATSAASAAFASTDLPALLAAHRVIEPCTRFELTLCDSLAELSVSDYDVAFSAERHLRDSSLICRPLSRTDEVIVASPAYLARHGEPLTPQALAVHDVLLSTDAPGTHWYFDEGDDDGTDTRRTVVGPVLNPQPPWMVRRAAAAGLGIARLPADFVAADLRDGRLTQLAVSRMLRQSRRVVWLLYPRQMHRNYTIRHFVDFVIDRYPGAGEPHTGEPADAVRRDTSLRPAHRMPGAVPTMQRP
ncbi:MAG: HTH-type transcriptional regulator PgrR [Burkholderia plantarii]|nr:MAG: HTH-type transcriptional regulator PgrR [Burkholderia plantarii]